jgi:hypothetical protein
VRQVPLQPVSHFTRHDQVVAALQDQGGDRRTGHVGADIGAEGHAREMLGDGGIVAAEAARQFLPQVRQVGRTHDRGRHLARPVEEIGLHQLQQAVDVVAVESADVVAVVDVAGRGPDQDLGQEAPRRRERRQQADRRADRMPHDDARARRAGIEDFQQIRDVALQAGVLRAVVGGPVGTAAARQVVQHDTEAVLEGRRQEAPHRLVATETMHENHGCRPRAGHVDVVAKLYRHG